MRRSAVALKQNIKSSWQRITKGPWLVLGTLVLISVLSFGLFLQANAQKRVSQQTTKPTQTVNNSSTSTSNQPNSSSPNGQTQNSSSSAQSGAGAGSSPGSSGGSNNSSSNTISPSAATTRIAVNINNQSNFTLSLPATANQCDVLSTALSEGKISQLDMRYNQSHGSYGVYKINSVGKSDAVWWVFTVNGVSPNKGCSHVKVNNNDQISWKYIGP